jgi:hypothetical protein
LAARSTQQALERGAVALEETRAALELEGQTNSARAQATAAILLARAENAAGREGVKILAQVMGCLAGMGLVVVLLAGLHLYLKVRIRIWEEGKVGAAFAAPLRGRGGYPGPAPMLPWFWTPIRKETLRLLAGAIRRVGSEASVIPSDDTLRMSRHARDEVVEALEAAGVVRVIPSVGTYVDERYGTLGRLYEAVNDGLVELPHPREKGEG